MRKLRQSILTKALLESICRPRLNSPEIEGRDYESAEDLLERIRKGRVRKTISIGF